MLTMDRKRFDQAAAKILSREHENHGIGTLGEKTLHAVVKNYVEPDEVEFAQKKSAEKPANKDSDFSSVSDEDQPFDGR